MTGTAKARPVSIAFLALLFAFLCAPSAYGTVFHVKEGGSGDGSSWASPLGEQGFIDALAAAVPGDEFWVASGTYRPTTNPSVLSASFILKSGVALYGGFAGTETSREDRDREANVTILTGDIDQNDASGGGNSGNSFHVILGHGTDRTAILDGFTVTGGNTNGSSGGGMYTYQGSPSVSYCTFTGNTAGSGTGGGMFNHTSGSAITGCIFEGNAAGIGGGIYNYNQSGGPTITDCSFSENSGGGMFNNGGSPVITNCSFTGNSSLSNNGGGMFNNQSSPVVTACTFSGNAAPTDFRGGGMFNSGGSPTLSGCIFSDNTASNGGGVYNNQSSLTVTECTFSGNSSLYANGSGGGMYSYDSTVTVTDCVFSENSALSNGGGMFSDSGMLSVASCIFSGNTAQGSYGGGGGMYILGGTSSVTSSTFTGNSARRIDGTGIYNSGGGIYSGGSGNPLVTNCTFEGNMAYYRGGGVYSGNTGTLAANSSTFTANSASQGGGLFTGYSSSASVTNSIFWGDTGGEIGNEGAAPAVSWSVVQGGFPGEGNMDSDPLLGELADNGGFTMTCALASGSPAIDGGAAPGAPSRDQRGVSRPQGGGFDMGAYEFAVSAIPTLLFPEDGATDVSLNPVLQAAAYEPSTGAVHSATQWQAGTGEDFSSGIVLDDTSGSTLTSFTVPGGILEEGTSYFWRARFRDSLGIWSDWSATWSFATAPGAEPEPAPDPEPDPDPSPDSSASPAGGGGCTTLGTIPSLLLLLAPLVVLAPGKK